MAEKKTTTTKKTTTKKTTTKTTTQKTSPTATCISGANGKKSFFQPLFDYIKKTNQKNWRKERVKCCKCGNEWNCIFPNVKNGEYKLQCPKCGARESMVITKK